MSDVEAAPEIAETASARVPLIRWTHGLVNRGVMLGDALALILASLLFCTHVLDAGAGLTLTQALVIGLVAAAGWIWMLRRAGAYRVERYCSLRAVGLDVPLGTLAAALLGGLIFMAFAAPQPGLLWASLNGLAALCVLVAERLLVAALVGEIKRQHLLRAKIAVIGATAEGLAIWRHLTGPDMVDRFDGVGLYSDRDDVSTLPLDAVSGGVADLCRYAERHPVDVIMVCLPWAASEQRHRIIEQVQWIAADVMVPLVSAEPAMPRAQIASVGGIQTLQLMHRPFKGSQGLLKIAEDYVVGALALLVFGPLMLLAALAIRLDSPGPALFRQARTGFNNQTFMIFKFRTMLVDPSDDGSVGTLDRANPRITRVGGLLRRLSIDELPQLLNVMRGEMSVVGPRPYVPNMLVAGQTRFTDTVRQYAARHRIKPGITGWAQANGLRGNALRTLEGAQRSVEMDIYYITHWSIWFDLQIMLRTVLVLTGRNVF